MWNDLGMDHGKIRISELNQRSKYARNLATIEALAPSRASLDYTLNALFFSKNLRPDLDRDTVASIFEGWFLARASRCGLVMDPHKDREELGEWISPAP